MGRGFIGNGFRVPRLAGLAAACTLIALVGAARASANTVPLPPFQECPAVGASPSCKVLIVVNPDRSVSVYDDPLVGDYDGGDDTLVGIWNQSPAPVDAVTVTGPGSGLAGFDGDGLCTYGVTGCPFGPSGYEGPGTAFVTDPANLDSAEIDFTGGLATGTTGYFSLEGTLTSASLTARQGHLLGGYVALGDSYSAGEGTGDYGYGTGGTGNHCDRSPHAYGPLLEIDRVLGPLSFAACSGAITADLVEANHEGNIDPSTNAPEAPQFHDLGASTSTITLTIGGNDLGFADIAHQCFFGRVSIVKVEGDAGCSSDKSVTGPIDARLKALAGTGTATTPRGVKIHSILSVLLAAHEAAPDARIYIAGYPQLFGTFKGECGVGSIKAEDVPVIGHATAAVKVTGTDAAYLDQVVAAITESSPGLITQIPHP